MEDKEQLANWWRVANGTGTEACKTCRPAKICAWHIARLEDLDELITARVVENERKIWLDLWQFWIDPLNDDVEMEQLLQDKLSETNPDPQPLTSGETG